MSRIAVVMLGVALMAAIPAPAVAAARSAAQSPGAAAAKPSPKPSAKPSPRRSPRPPAQPSRPAPPSLPTPVPSEPRPTQQCPGQGSPRVRTQPWAQQALDFSSAWPLAQGRGVTVAVVDSGVDYSPQLAGKVTAVDLTGTGFQDCVGHGTEIAAIIAASDMQAQGVPFEGVAPGARILSVKVNSADQGSSVLMAQGIRNAASLGARVINVSITTRDTPVLRSAVTFALSQGAVIVAAGGNDTTTTGVGPFYPASYPGVLSVGAVASDGSLAPISDQRSHVAVTAPGVNVTSACPGGYQQDNLTGTSYATAFVSGVAALLRSRYPGMAAAQVVRRIEATANGGSGPGTGDGLVNPLQAVTAILPARAAPSPSPSVRPQPVSVSRARPPDRATPATAAKVTAGALGAAVLVALGAVVISQGRRRRWRAGRTEVPAAGGDVADDPWS
jgi:type VII secretion-associated serine protease mycosin